jgi:malonyl-CoA/methylmalonyl-CoA synthetase
MASAAATPAWAGHIPAGSDFRPADLLEDRSVPARIVRCWRERPSWRQLQDIDGSWIESGRLEERTRIAAARLQAAGLRAGDRFVVSAGTSAQFVTVYVAALRAGLVVVPLNTAYTRTEVERIVHDAAPSAAAVDDADRARWIRDASDGPVAIADLDLEFGCGHDGAGSSSADSALDRAGAEGLFGDDAIDRAGADDPALLVYTSGTTGRPKGALLTHGNLLASATAVEIAWRWHADDVLLLTLPLFHVHGLGVGINGSLCVGSSVVLRPRFDALEVGERCAAGGASMFFGVPTMYQRLASSGHAASLRGLRLLVSGSAPLPAALAEEVAAQAGQIPLERYGMTETIMLTSNPHDGPRKPGTVGFPLPGVELRLVGDAGEVEVRGPNVIAGYYQRPAANAESYTADGWFRTGDLGTLDGDGYLTLNGRSKELIITGGYNVYPREVEEVLAAHPDVREVAVVGRPSETWGEEVTAVIVAERAIPVDELRAHAARELAPYKVPKRFEFADDLPRNAMGKIVRGQLSETPGAR